jgi:hypothetical protein
MAFELSNAVAINNLRIEVARALHARAERNSCLLAYSLDMAEHWDLLFTLPNLAVAVPTPFATDGWVICSGDDPRLRDLAATAGNKTAREMLDSFMTARGEPYKPGCLLIRSDVSKRQRNAEAIRAFRNEGGRQ